MKKFLTLLTIIAFVSFQAFGQEKEQNVEKLEALEADNVAVAQDTIIQDASEETVAVTDSIDLDIAVVEADDEVSFQIGDKEITIRDNGEENDSDDEDEYEWENNEEDWENVGGARSFEGHLGGFEFGFNSFGSKQFSTSIDGSSSDWDLNSAKSSSFNIILPNLDLGFCRRIGIVTSLGFNFNNYRFDNNLTIDKDPVDGITRAFDAPAGIEYEKSKLATIYATIPVMLEAQIPLSDGNALNFGVGVIGAIKLGSHTKVVYNDDGKQKDKNHDDFNLNLLRYGVTARVGYKMFQIYGTSYLTPLFEDGKGPELYPFEIGIALTFND